MISSNLYRSKNFEVRTLGVEGPLLVSARRFGDARGHFSETYSRQDFTALGIAEEMVQDNYSFSAPRGTVRGLHFQVPPRSQAKLVRVLRGRILDVAVDIRHGSPGYRVENHKLVVDEAGAATVCRVFEGFAELRSGSRLLPILRGEGLLTKTGRPFDKSALYKLLVNRVYIGEAVHKGTAYPGEHDAIIPRHLWDRVHAILAESPRVRAAQARQRAPALLRGLLFGPDGRAMSPSHTRKKGRLYRYYVSQALLQGGANDAPHRRLPAGEIEGLVMAQVRALLRQPEVVVGTWRAARLEDPGITEAEVRDALGRLDPLWDEMFPAEQERIVGLLVERVTVGEAGAEIRFNLEGLAGLARDLAAKWEALAA